MGGDNDPKALLYTFIVNKSHGKTKTNDKFAPTEDTIL